MEKVLNKRLMDTLEVPESGRLVTRDKTQKGLRVRVTPAGAKSFSVIYRFEGRQRRMSLGKWPETTVAVARAGAKQVLESVAAGIDPSRKGAKTVKDVAIKYDEACRRTLVNHKKVRRVIEMHVLPPIGNKLVRDLRRRDVQEIIDSLVDDGRDGAAVEVQSHFYRMLNWAEYHEVIDANPMPHRGRSKLKINKDAGRELSLDELKSVWAAAKEMGYPFGDLYRLLLLTGQRRSDWGKAVWDEIGDDTLTIPKARYKSRREHIVPLSEAARQVVNGLPRQDGPYLFSTTAGDVAVGGWSRSKKQLDKASGVTGWRTHDLRVSVESRLAAMRVPMEVRDACLGHARPGMQRIYNKYDFLDEKREALEAFAKEVTL